MRILHFVHAFPPESFGGTQNYVAAVATRQMTAGHDVRVVCGANELRDDGDIRESIWNNLRVVRIHRRRDERLSGDLGSERIKLLVRHLVLAFAADVVHIHHWHGLTRDLVQTLQTPGSRVFVTLHDLYTTCARHFRMPDHRHLCATDVSFAECARCLEPDVAGMPIETLEHLISQRFLTFQKELAAADGVFCVSEAQRRLLLDIPGFDDPGLLALPIGIDFPGPSAAGPPLDGRLRLVNWAGLDPRKGPHLILEALHSSPHRAAFEVHFYGRNGEPEYMAELHRLAEGLSVFFHGPYADKDRAGFACQYDLAVFPFLAFETYGLVVDEALFLGLPVVVSARGAPPERLGGRGLTFEAENAEALQKVLTKLLANPETLQHLRNQSHNA